MLRRLPALLLCLALPFAACDSDTDGDGDGDGGLGAGIAATIDGDRFVATGITAAGRNENNTAIGLTGTDGTTTIVLVIGGVAEGTYPVGSETGASIQQSAGAQQFVSMPESGAIRITSVSSSRVAGTFSFDAVSVTGGGTLEVTNGEFDVALVTN